MAKSCSVVELTPARTVSAPVDATGEMRWYRGRLALSSSGGRKGFLIQAIRDQSIRHSGIEPISVYLIVCFLSVNDLFA